MCPDRLDEVDSSQRRPVIAIDGPGGAGKSTIARRLAARLGFLYLDTGAMYRAVTWAAVQAGLVAADGALDPDGVAGLAESAVIEFRRGGQRDRVLVNGKDVTNVVRQPEVERLVPRVAALPGVRRALIPQQRRLAAAGGVVLDGRDIGTAVLPDAEYKFFVTAHFDTRVDRRWHEIRRRGHPATHAEVAEDLRRRDHADESRNEGALRRAAGAHLLDTTELTVDEAVESVLSACPDLAVAAMASDEGEAGRP